MVTWWFFADINGDALHASVGLPPALNVTTAKVGKLEIIVSTLSISDYILNCQFILDILSHLYFTTMEYFILFLIWKEI